MVFTRITRAVLGSLGVVLFGVGSAGALQFTPPSTARLHTITSGELGAEWNTSGLGAGGEISYDSGTGTLSVTGVLDVLNYFDPANGACSTDTGSNCSHNYTTDLDITLEASFVGLTVNPIAGTIVEVVAEFETTGGVDLTVTDSTDPAVVLEASWSAGTFQGTATTGLSTSVFFDTSTGLVLGAPPVNAVGFLSVDQSSTYADLTLPDFFAINFGSLDDFDDGSGGDLSAIVAASVLAGTLVDFTAEANGQVFRTASGDFVPGPAALLTFGTSFLGLGLHLRRRSRRTA